MDTTHTKLNRVHGSRNGLLIESLIGNLLESIINDLFDLFSITRLDTLETKRKGGLKKFIRQTSSSNGSTETTFHKVLAQNRR